MRIRPAHITVLALAAVLAFACESAGGDAPDATTGTDVSYLADGAPHLPPDATDPTADAATADAGATDTGTDTASVVDTTPPTTGTLDVAPSSLHFGHGPVGGVTELSVTVTNVDPTNALTLEEPTLTEDSSPDFSLVAVPETLTLGAGEHATITIRYAPDAPGLDRATLRIRQDAPGVNAVLVPLNGGAGLPGVTFSPSPVTFGVVDIGSRSERQVRVTNTGDVPLSIDGLSMATASSRAFALTELPTLPVALEPGEDGFFSVAFAPTEPGDFSGQVMAIVVDRLTNLPARESLPVEGSSERPLREDTFPEAAGGPVDVLFVIDDSGSMCEEQERLAEGVPELIAQAEGTGRDYRIGVVSVCVESGPLCPMAGHLVHAASDERRWVAADNLADLETNLALGCSGGSDAQEAGLEAARMTLSAPLAALSDTPCENDFGCPPSDLCVPDVELCGGPNAGFRRDDASLHVIFLSDEDDQSPDTVDTYVGFLRELAGPAGAYAHAVVGDAVDGCGWDGGGTTAEAGARYIAAAERTGGVVGSICDESFSAVLGAIGAMAFETRTDFALAETPQPDSIVVLLDGEACAEGWSYDAESNSVVVPPDSPCRPAPGQTLTIRYATVGE